MLSSRKSRLAVPAALLALTATACGGGSTGGGTTPGGTSTQSKATENAVKGGTLNVLGSGDVDYMDPNITYYSVGYMAARVWSRQLMTYPADPQKNTTAVPDLIEALPTSDNGGISADGLTYTMKIKQGAQWDTTPARQITAADEVYGVKRTCNPAQPFGGSTNYVDLIVGMKQFCDGFANAGQDAAAIAAYIKNTPLEGVQAKDASTVVFKLATPASYFVDMLTLPALGPAPEEYNKYVPASAELAQNTIASGPYKVQSYDPTKKIVFARNPAWKAESDPIRKAYVDSIIIDETVSQESTQQQLETNSPGADMEFDNFPPPAQIPRLRATKDPNLNLGFTASSNPYVVYNIISPNNNGALNKVEVRQALSYATNRQNIIQALGGPDLNQPLAHVLPDSLVGGKPDFDPYPYNPDKAKQLLAQAGFPNGITMKFLYRNASEGSRKTFATIQQDWSKAGITVQGVAVPNADFYTKYLEVPDVAKRGVFDVSLAGWGADWYGNAAASFFKPLFFGPPSFPPNGSNFGYYNSQTVIDLVGKAAAAKSENEAADLWHQADVATMKDAPFFPITNPKQANYHATQVHNAIYLPAVQNFDMTNVWLDPSKNGG